MIERTEILESQCPCGQPLTAVIFHCRRVRTGTGRPVIVRHSLVKIFQKIGDANRRKLVKRCPTCDKDFTRLTAEQVKENIWTS